MNAIPIKQKKKLNRTFLLNALVCAAVAISSVAVGVRFGVTDFVERDVFFNGISINSTGVGGLTLDEARGKLEQSELEKLNQMSLTLRFNSEDTVLTYQQLGLSTDLDDVLRRAHQYADANSGEDISQKYDTVLSLMSGKNFTTSVTLNEDTLSAAIRQYTQVNGIDPIDASASYDAASDTFVYTDGQVGFKINYDSLMQEVKNRIAANDFSTLSLTGTAVQPKLTTQMLIDNTVLIGEYSTIANTNEGRNINIRLMCEAIDGLKLEVGQTLSLNELVGKRTPEKGFKSAPAIADGILVSDIGGGICQLSGTLYNAALLANMEIVERVHHTWPSDYLPIGQDSTLNWNDKDLKIRNNSEWPIYVYGRLENDTVRVKLYGQPLPEGIELVIRNELLEEIPAPRPEVILTNDLPAGVSKTKYASRAGYKVKIYRDFFEGETLTRSELVSSDYYRPQQGVVLKGAEAGAK